MRTDAQITRDMEQAYAALEKEAKRRAVDPALNFPCKTCRYSGDLKGQHRGKAYRDKYCHSPLIKGFRHAPKIWDDVARYQAIRQDEKALVALCGPEKALWRLRPNWWQRIIEMVLRRPVMWP